MSTAAVIPPLPWLSPWWQRRQAAASRAVALALLGLGTLLGCGGGALAQAGADTGAIAQPATSDSIAGAKGAKIYCYMRMAGNTHKVSWEAAYALVKRQNSALFKTSPEHAAVMITEAVVNNPSAFPDCGKFLGDLFVK